MMYASQVEVEGKRRIVLAIDRPMGYRVSSARSVSSSPVSVTRTDAKV